WNDVRAAQMNFYGLCFHMKKQIVNIDKIKSKEKKGNRWILPISRSNKCFPIPGSCNMGRIKKILFMHRANTKKAREKKELKDKDKDDLPIIDDAYDLENDEAAETVFRKLIENAKEMDYNKNSRWRYTGNSDRTRQRRTRQNRINAVGSYKITQFFALVNNINEATGDQQSDSESDSDLELEEKPLKWKQQLQETEKRIQNLLDTTEMSKTDKVKYVSVIHYIRLLQHDSSKMEASRVVATIHNGGEYRARCI
ncbi:5547_t:CDS:2, partial [Dentiscutata heterogama]